MLSVRTSPQIKEKTARGKFTCYPCLAVTTLSVARLVSLFRAKYFVSHLIADNNSFLDAGAPRTRSLHIFIVKWSIVKTPFESSELFPTKTARKPKVTTKKCQSLS